MGKAKPRYKSHRKHNSRPSGIQVPSLEDESSEELECSSNSYDESTIPKLVEEIQSANVEERLCGLQSLATLSGKPNAIEAIIENKVIKIVAPLLVDKSSEVRNVTAGFLRNLSASNSPEVCERLVEDDIMTPLIALINQYTDWKPTSKSEDTDTLLQAVNILWNLCENDDTALKYFSSANLLSVLLKCLDPNTVGPDLSIAVCQCLNAVSEDNESVITVLRSHESELFSLLSISAVTNKLLFLKTLVAGIVLNLNPSRPWLAAVLAVIKEALDGDLRAATSQLSSQLPLDDQSVDELTADSQELLDNVLTLVDTQIIALEILTNIISSQDDEMDVESEEESVSEGEEEVNGWSDVDDSRPLALSPEISEGLEGFKLVSAVLKLLDPFPENVINIIKSCRFSKTLGNKLERLQVRAFLCFNNIVAPVELEQMGGPGQLLDLIKHISRQRLFQFIEGKEPTNLELLEAATAAIRAILVRLAEVKYTELGKAFQLDDLQAFFKLGISSELRVQANVIRIVSSVAILAAETAPEIVKMTGLYLLEAAEKQQALWLTAEAVDALLDVFAEDCTDATAAEIGLVKRLEGISPQLKTKMRKERKTLGDHYPLVSTVMTNLNPFIKYKGKRVAVLNKK